METASVDQATVNAAAHGRAWPVVIRSMTVCAYDSVLVSRHALAASSSLAWPLAPMCTDVPVHSCTLAASQHPPLAWQLVPWRKARRAWRAAPWPTSSLSPWWASRCCAPPASGRAGTAWLATTLNPFRTLFLCQIEWLPCSYADKTHILCRFLGWYEYCSKSALA